MRARIVIYDDLMELDDTEVLSNNREQVKSIAHAMLKSTPNAEMCEVYDCKTNKMIMKFVITRKGNIKSSRTIHPNWGGRRPGQGAPSKGDKALVNRVVVHVDKEMFDFLETLDSKPEYIRQAIKEKMEREKGDKG